MQWNGERTRLACRRGRLDNDFKIQNFLSPFGAERMVVGSIRRDAQYHTPEAYAPHFNCMDSVKIHSRKSNLVMLSVLALCLTAVGGISHSSKAAVIAYEGFDYTARSALAGQAVVPVGGELIN